MRRFIYKSSNGQTIEFSKKSDFKLTHIDGINSLDVSLSEASAELQVGTQITSRKVEPRPITLEGDFRKNYINRKALIDAFAPLSTGRLNLIDDENSLNVYIDLEVKRTPFISEDCVYQKFQISLFASFPFWKSASEESYKFFAYTSHYRFPQSFSSTVPFKISSRDFLSIVNVKNKGTVPTGFTISIKALDRVTAPKVTKVVTQEAIKMDDSFTLENGMQLFIFNYQNDLRIVKVADGIETNVFGSIDIDATTFFELGVGDNIIQIDSAQGAKKMDVTIFFDDMIAGV